jgi:phage tail sheath protein FI
MPVTVSYPGVYIDEVSSGVHTITSVSTSIAAFLGRASKGKINRAERCLSLADFQRKFGAPHPQSDLGHAVRHFFANGGTDCYVVRLANAAKTASITLHSLAAAAQPVLVATAKSEGAWANQLRLEVSYATANAHDTFNLTVIQQEGTATIATERHINLSMNPLSPRFAPAFVTQSSDLIELKLAAAMGDPASATSTINTLGNSLAGYSQARRPLGATAAAAATTLQGWIAGGQDTLAISVNDGPAITASLAGAALTAANVEAELSLRLNTALSALSPTPTVAVTLENGGANVGQLLTVTAANGSRSAVRITRASARDIAGVLLAGVEQGGLEQTRYSNFRPAPTASLWHMHTGAVAPFDHLNLRAHVNALAGLAQNAITSIAIDGQPAITLNAAPHNLITTAGADFWHQLAAANGDGVREKLGIIAAAINAQAVLPYKAELWGYEIALISKAGTLNALPSAIAILPATVVGDNALNTGRYALGNAGTSTFTSVPVIGDEGGPPTAADYVGNPVDQTGFHALDSVDLFNLMVLPPDAEVSAAIHQTLWNPASVYCQAHRAFLLIDSPASWTSNDGRPLVAGNTALIGQLNVPAKKNAAVFYPRVVFDNAGLKRTTGASGAIAGLMARTDATRGVWKAPAGVEADVRDVLGIDVRLTDIENGVLNKKAVNCLRVFPNGLVNWGARTLDGDDDFGSEWKYIPIRRLALNIEESLFRGTKWVVFEPNDEPLWAKIRLNLNAYMMSLFRQGAFQGTSPKDAFFVKCDKDTTTQDDRNKGIVNIEVGFAPLKPAEFVVIKIQQIAGDL